MRINRLAWDSDFFGFEVGRLDLTDAVAPEQSLHTVLQDSPFQLVYVIQHNPDKQMSALIEKLGGQLYDQKITYSKSLTDSLANLPDVTSYNGPLTEELEILAYISGTYSRFYSDSRLQPYYKSMYRTWMENSLSGKIADQVFVSLSENSIIGMLTCSIQENVGQVGLIAVAEEYRGQGRAKQLIHTFDQWCLSKNLQSATIITQERNTPACMLYEQAGYHISNKQSIFHYWKEQKTT